MSHLTLARGWVVSQRSQIEPGGALIVLSHLSRMDKIEASQMACLGLTGWPSVVPRDRRHEKWLSYDYSKTIVAQPS